MTKALAIVGLLFISSTVFGATSGLVVVKGRVDVQPKFRNFQPALFSDGTLVGASPILRNKNTAGMAKRGFSMTATDGSNVELKDCTSAVVTLVGGEGNFLPNANGEESYSTPQVVGFACLD